MSIVQTLDHANIVLHFPCREAEAAGSFKTERGATITATLGAASPVGAYLNIPNVNNNTALASGTLTGITAGADWALMAVLNMNHAAASAFRIGHDTTDHTIGCPGGGNITIRGTAGTATLTAAAPALQTASRLLVTCEVGGLIRTGKSALGSALSYSATTASQSVCGNLTTFTASLSFASFGNTLLYGMQLVQFPDGLPTDIVDQGNALMTLWEAGNHTHYPLVAE